MPVRVLSGVVGQTAGGIGAVDWAASVQNLAALTALTTSDYADKQIRFVEDQGYSYRFDLESTAVADSPDTLVPDASPAAGRWIRIIGLGGDVVGPTSTADTAIARYSGTGGKSIQSSTVRISDSGSTTYVNSDGSLHIRCPNSLWVGDDDADSVRLGRTNTALAKVHLRSGSDSDLVVSDGKVGIGMDDPSHSLEIDGDIQLTPTAISTAHIASAGSLKIDADNNIEIGHTLVDSVRIGRSNTGVVKVHVRSGSDSDLVVSDSKVGIGTETPNCMLHVSGAAAFSGPSETYVTFGSSDTTPSVATGNLFVAPGAVTITTFDDGVAGQTITVISTAAVVFDVTSTTLKGGSTNITTASGDVTTWTFDGTNWYLIQFMDVSADMSSVGGGGATAADDISTGDAATSLATSSGSVTVDSQASTVLVDGHTGVEVTSTGSGTVTIDGKAGVAIEENGQSVITIDTNADTLFAQTGGSVADPDVEFDGVTRFDGTLAVGSDADGADRIIHFGHSTNKTVMGIYDSEDVFAIRCDATSLTNDDNALEINASNQVFIEKNLVVGNNAKDWGTEAGAINALVVTHRGGDEDNGMMLVRDDNTSTNADNILGGIGFDSTDGQVPSDVLEASCYIAGFAAEAHGNSDKGGYLTFGTAAINDDDDTTSHERMRIKDDGHVTITSTTANATGGGADGSGGSGIAVYVAKVNGEIVTTILIDLTGLANSGAVGDVIGEDGVAAAYLTQITTAVNGVVYKAEMSCVEVPAGTNCALDIDLNGNSTSLAEDASLGSGGTTTSLILAGADWTAGTRRVSTAGADLSGLVDDYLYLSDGTGGASGGTYTGGKFVIKLYGSDF